eukprot:TRINITY_DN206_c0_g2_i1.p1 TRINITY_DN206_c0_g2~~TRINITY_DN206_c0_g2_i1.p1  ORF type:complete len:679 (-),score=165.91 TRINITY_DN206_c0_g2_i1:68-2104(-)
MSSGNNNETSSSVKEDELDKLYKQAGRYIPPHERRRLQAQAEQPKVASEIRSSSKGGEGSDRERSNFERPSQFQSSGPKGYPDRGPLASSGRGSGPGNSSGSRPWNSNSGSSGSGGGGGSKWKDSPSVKDKYGPDGLMQADPKLEQELFSRPSSGINFQKYEDIPVVVEPNEFKPLESFQDIDLGPVLNNTIKLANFTAPTPVQKYSIPIILSNRDLMACAQTGSGKTGAFLFPLIASILSTPSDPKKSYYGRNVKASPECLILAPTRELAIQIQEEARRFVYRSHLRAVVVYGGAEFRRQAMDLERGCNLLVATPGRLIDMVDRGKLTLSEIRYLCIDEADRMLDMGFEKQIRQIVDKCPSVQERQTLMFSATFPKTIQRLAEDFLKAYVFLKVGRIGSTTDFIKQRIKYVEDQDKKYSLLELLPTVKGRTLVFVETKRLADHLEEYLYTQGFSTISIHGDRTQKEREAALEAFRTGQAQILVATDVAARGLDIKEVMHVINYDMPTDIDDYVHRIGRTGRAGHEGIATAFLNEKNKNIVRDLVELLDESSQPIDPWLNELAHSGYGGGYNRNARRGGGGGGRGSRYMGGSSRVTSYVSGGVGGARSSNSFSGSSYSGGNYSGGGGSGSHYSSSGSGSSGGGGGSGGGGSHYSSNNGGNYASSNNDSYDSGGGDNWW